MYRILTLALLLPLLCHSAVAASESGDKRHKQAYYLVFSLDENQEPILQYQQLVTLSEAPTGDAPQELHAGSRSFDAREDLFIARITDENGQQLFQKTVTKNHDVRAEFAGSDGIEIEHQEIEAINQAFVLRIPVISDATLWIENDRLISEFSINAIATESTGARSHVQNALRTEDIGGDPSNRVDILMMGDGYTVDETTLFESDVQNFSDNFFSVSPYLEYRSFVNSASLFVASRQSGADHPPFDAECAQSDNNCCADTIAENDALAGTFVDTAFDSTFCSQNLHRLLGINYAKVYEAAAAYPDWDSIIVLVNDPSYGGSGGSVSVASTAGSYAVSLVQHEFGHSFTRLADEYDSPYPGYPACSDLQDQTEFPACRANVTDEINVERIKWTPWISFDTPIPTLPNAGYQDVVGLFEGAQYKATGMYRPQEYCGMRNLNTEFCAICQQAYVLRMYQGGWGYPLNGIELIEPGSAFPTSEAVSTSGPVELSVDVLEPAGGVSIQWKVNGEIQPGESAGSFTFEPDIDGLYTVEVEVTDPTTKVHPDMNPQSATSSQHSWTVTASGIESQFVINPGLNDVWYFPVTNGQGFFITVFPDIEYVSLSWFTYDTVRPYAGVTANLGEPGHRWLNALGKYAGNQAVLDISVASGGLFDTPSDISEVNDGTIILSFSDCNSGTVEYNIPSIGRQNVVPIRRVVDDNIPLCESMQDQGSGSHARKASAEDSSLSTDTPVTMADAQALAEINTGLNDVWFNPATAGQGFFINVFPEIEYISLSWFTYDTVRPDTGVSANLGEPGHRWLNALGRYTGNRATLDITIASGGLFDTPTIINETSDGTINLLFSDCNSGTIEYDIPSIAGKGVVPVRRVVDDNIALCEALNTSQSLGIP